VAWAESNDDMPLTSNTGTASYSLRPGQLFNSSARLCFSTPITLREKASSSHPP
jgi:hypothetical protein